MIENKIKDILKNKIKDSKIFIQDMNGQNNHFSVIVISEKFEGFFVFAGMFLKVPSSLAF